MRPGALWLAIGLAANGLVPQSAAWVTLPQEELRAGYDTLWAVSDLHGRREALERLLLAARLAVPAERGASVRWNPEKRRQLFIVVGDLIDGGEDSVGTVLLLRDLQREAETAGSRVIVLLGNHEVAFLADPRACATPELMRSASRRAARLALQAAPTAKQLSRSAFGDYLRSLPIAAFVGTWLFVHGGYLDGGTGRETLRAYLVRLAGSLEHRDGAGYRLLRVDGAITGDHRWWAKPGLVSGMKSRLDLLGLDGLVIGHDPDALGAAATIAMSRNGWLMKLDTGLKRGSRGMLLRCQLAEVFAPAASPSAMSRCEIVGEDGSRLPMVVR